MTKDAFFSQVEITTPAECNGIVDNTGESHVWVEWGMIDGQEVLIEYYVDDVDGVDWDASFTGAWYWDIDQKGAEIC